MTRGKSLYEFGRVSTQSIQDKYDIRDRRNKRYAMSMAMVYLALGTFAFWCSREVPSSCNVRLRTFFISLGILDTLQAPTSLVILLFMPDTNDLQRHLALANKYEREGRHEEASQEIEQYGLEMGDIDMLKFGTYTPLFCIIQLVQVVIWCYGFMKALHAKPRLCGDARAMFWVFATLHALIRLVDSCWDRMLDAEFKDERLSPIQRGVSRMEHVTSDLESDSDRSPQE